MWRSDLAHYLGRYHLDLDPGSSTTHATITGTQHRSPMTNYSPSLTR
ncbi:hypothetical protein GXW82_00020 [Streptacidiphilus sp. 4-A2]|nr:hypothetical protein [Streptacidiphilus sp. 4-A2]